MKVKANRKKEFTEIKTFKMRIPVSQGSSVSKESFAIQVRNIYRTFTYKRKGEVKVGSLRKTADFFGISARSVGRLLRFLPEPKDKQTSFIETKKWKPSSKLIEKSYTHIKEKLKQTGYDKKIQKKIGVKIWFKDKEDNINFYDLYTKGRHKTWREAHEDIGEQIKERFMKRVQNPDGSFSYVVKPEYQELVEAWEKKQYEVEASYVMELSKNENDLRKLQAREQKQQVLIEGEYHDDYDEDELNEYIGI